MNTILLTNLIKIRWIAIFGQLSAIFFVQYILEIQLLFFECILVIMLSVIINLGAFFFQKKIKISDEVVFLFLLFDTTQLGVLLYLNGGILNPFSILILAPVIISATYLKSYWTVFLSLYSIFHGNLNYSSIDKELYEHIIDACYWPIIDLVNEYNFKPAIEFPINTIHKINDIDNLFIPELKKLVEQDKIEII